MKRPLSRSNYFVLRYLGRGRSYIFEIASASQKTSFNKLSEKAVRSSLKELQSNRLAKKTSLEESRIGPARQYWEITDEGRKVLLEEYEVRIEDLHLFPQR